MSFEKMKKLKKWQFYVLSFTWGLPLSLAGAVVCLTLLLAGGKPQKYGHCYYVAAGKNWGGFSMGWFFLVDKNAPIRTKDHEMGHGYQNACKYGPFTVMLTLISVCRYWYDRLIKRINYEAYFFEKEASELGKYIFDGSEGGKYENIQSKS